MRERECLAAWDIGASHVRFRVETLTGEVLESQRFVFREASTSVEELRSNTASVWREFATLDTRLVRAAVGCAAIFDRRTGVVTRWPNRPSWAGLRIQSLLNAWLGLPVVLEDDATCAVVGEHVWGAGRGIDDFAMVVAGTGVGCGLVLGGRLYRGSGGRAGELGHVPIGSGQTCTCGNVGCLQAVASGPAIAVTYLRRGGTLGRAGDAREVAERAAHGEMLAREVLSDAAKQLGHAIAGLSLLLDLQTVILGGGVVTAGPLFVDGVRAGTQAWLHSWHRGLRIDVGELGDEAGVRGAMSLVSADSPGYPAASSSSQHRITEGVLP